MISKSEQKNINNTITTSSNVHGNDTSTQQKNPFLFSRTKQEDLLWIGLLHPDMSPKNSTAPANLQIATKHMCTDNSHHKKHQNFHMLALNFIGKLKFRLSN